MVKWFSSGSSNLMRYSPLSHTWSISSLILFIFPHVIREFWVMIQVKKERNSHNLINKLYKRSTSKITIKYVINRLLHVFLAISSPISAHRKLPYHLRKLQAIWVFFVLIRVMVWQKPCNTILVSLRFWRVGSHLLNNFFIRMMSGPKLEGLAATYLTQRGK